MKNVSSIYSDLNKHTLFYSYMKFILLSGVGIFLFMIPITKDGGVSIAIADLSSWLQIKYETQIPNVIFGIIVTTFLLTIISTISTRLGKNLFKRSPFLHSLFNVSPIWVVIRTLSFIFVCMIYFQVGIPAIYNENTGGMIFDSLLPILFSVFLFASLFLPLLLNFGLLEFVGYLLIRVMRPLFNLPGRSAVDCIASWLGDGTIGVLLTSKQYEEGFYTKREAAVIGTTFSLVSITFSLVVIEQVGLSDMFLPYYGTVCIASLACALIIPKLPPLSRIPNVYANGATTNNVEDIPKGFNAITFGLNAALKKAEQTPVFRALFINGIKNVVDMWFAVIPIVLAIGTVALVVAEFTPFFKILGIPFYPLLAILQVPEPMLAAQTLVAGFADMLLPSIMASQTIESEMTRFIVASVSVTQLIYLSEVGALLLGSKIPLRFRDLFYIFILRTVIAIPIVAAIAHLLY